MWHEYLEADLTVSFGIASVRLGFRWRYCMQRMIMGFVLSSLNDGTLTRYRRERIDGDLK